MYVRFFRLGVVVGSVIGGSFFTACSDDSEPGGTAGSAGSTGATGGSSGASGASGAGGSDAGLPTRTCGTQVCNGVPAIPILLPSGIPPCCSGPAADKCGFDATQFGAGCIETDQPGNPDSTCFATPDAGGSGGSGARDAATLDAGTTDAGATDGGTVDADGTAGTGGGGAGGFGGIPINGCCKPNGQCGILLNLPGFMFGCVEITAVDGGLPPQSCTPSGT